MHKIYSKVDPSILLHIICRSEDFVDGRLDISPETEYLQASALKMDAGKTFRPHKHITCHRATDITQESWIVLSGAVIAILYDIDDTVAEEVILNAGDTSITFRGGHNYRILEDDTRVIEMKTGPYMGQTADKVFI